jgi:hypothetical protein
MLRGLPRRTAEAEGQKSPSAALPRGVVHVSKAVRMHRLPIASCAALKC